MCEGYREINRGWELFHIFTITWHCSAIMTDRRCLLCPRCTLAASLNTRRHQQATPTCLCSFISCEATTTTFLTGRSEVVSRSPFSTCDRPPRALPRRRRPAGTSRRTRSRRRGTSRRAWPTPTQVSRRSSGRPWRAAAAGSGTSISRHWRTCWPETEMSRRRI